MQICYVEALYHPVWRHVLDALQDRARKDNLYPPDPSVLPGRFQKQARGRKTKRMEAREGKTTKCQSEADCQDGKITQ